MVQASTPKPTFLITYYCHRCQLDSAVADTKAPLCYYCDQSDQLEVTKREEITEAVLAERLKIVCDRLCSNLASAVNCGQGPISDDEQKAILLGDEFRQLVKSEFERKSKKY